MKENNPQNALFLIFVLYLLKKVFQIYVDIRRKAMTNLDSILKSRDITLLTTVCLIKAMVFPVVMYGCESWTIKKAEAKELIPSNCGAGEDSWESLGQQGDQTSHS